MILCFLQAIASLREYAGLLPVLDYKDMQVSELLKGLKISRVRSQTPVPINVYCKRITKLHQTLRDTQDEDVLVTRSFGGIKARVTRYDIQ